MTKRDEDTMYDIIYTVKEAIKTKKLSAQDHMFIIRAAYDDGILNIEEESWIRKLHNNNVELIE